MIAKKNGGNAKNGELPRPEYIHDSSRMIEARLPGKFETRSFFRSLGFYFSLGFWRAANGELEDIELRFSGNFFIGKQVDGGEEGFGLVGRNSRSAAVRDHADRARGGIGLIGVLMNGLGHRRPHSEHEAEASQPSCTDSHFVPALG